jgi:hypothetical protein
MTSTATNRTDGDRVPRVGPGRAHRFRGTVVPLCDGRVMTSAVTTRAEAADRVARWVRAELASFGALSYLCAMVGS